MTEIPEEIKREAKKELARRDFWEFEKTLYPEFFYDERKLLKEMATTLQNFIEDSKKHYLVLSVPPGHFKSFTGKNLALWLLGKDPTTRFIGVANSGDLASMFSTQVRDTILGVNTGKGGIPYPEIFPDTKVKYGFATKSKWELEGSAEPSYRSVSPTSSVTGSRADIFLIDDIIKGYAQSLNSDELKKHFEFYRNTLFSRTDGDDYKFIIIMQRWATNDLAGEIIKLYGDDVIHINYSIEDEDGNMLDPTILSREKFEQVKLTTEDHVLEANYYQHPVDIKGRLYDNLMTYDVLPEGNFKKWSYTDTADKGADYLVTVNYILTDDKKVYITDVVCTDEAMEITEPLVAKSLHDDGVHEAVIESNNGGRGFGRNVKRILQDTYSNFKVVITDLNQRSNKESRIITSSSWVKQNVHFPAGWDIRYPEFFKQVMSYQSKGKNKNDDAVDVLAGIYDTVNAGMSYEDLIGFSN